MASRNIAYLIKASEILQPSYCDYQYLIFSYVFVMSKYTRNTMHPELVYEKIDRKLRQLNSKRHGVFFISNCTDFGYYKLICHFHQLQE